MFRYLPKYSTKCVQPVLLLSFHQCFIIIVFVVIHNTLCKFFRKFLVVWFSWHWQYCSHFVLDSFVDTDNSFSWYSENITFSRSPVICIFSSAFTSNASFSAYFTCIINAFTVVNVSSHKRSICAHKHMFSIWGGIYVACLLWPTASNATFNFNWLKSLLLFRKGIKKRMSRLHCEPILQPLRMINNRSKHIQH